MHICMHVMRGPTHCSLRSNSRCHNGSIIMPQLRLVKSVVPRKQQQLQRRRVPCRAARSDLALELAQLEKERDDACAQGE